MPASPEICQNQEFLKPGSPTISKSVEELTKIFKEKESADMIPDAVPNNKLDGKKIIKNGMNSPLLTDDGLILPKKPANPCLESLDRQNLHRELKFNQKIGKNVLNQKSELQRALEKHKDAQARKCVEKNVTAVNPEFERVIAERAKKLIEPTQTQEEIDKSLNRQFLEARAKLRTRTESK